MLKQVQHDKISGFPIYFGMCWGDTCISDSLAISRGRPIARLLAIVVGNDGKKDVFARAKKKGGYF